MFDWLLAISICFGLFVMLCFGEFGESDIFSIIIRPMWYVDYLSHFEGS